MNRPNKLVRDRIPEICETNGDVAEVRIIEDDDEYLQALCDKLREEAQEVTEAPSIEELADTLEVLNALAKTLGYTPEQVESVRAQKAEDRGGFDKRIFLISTRSGDTSQ